MVEYGLIGRGISHSYSARYFNDKFAKEGLDCCYLAFDLEDISELRKIIEEHPNLHGLNVTSPYKREVISFLDELSPEAERLQAVNVIEFIRDKKGNFKSLKGHNTDCLGFEKSLEPLLTGIRPKAMILGTGGAASAVECALENLGIDYVTVSRQSGIGRISYEKANGLLKEFGLIINATPVGMYPDVNALPPLDCSMISKDHLCYDLIYNPGETLFLKIAKEHGAKTKNGLEMLKNQADLAWDIWTGNVNS